MIREQEGVEIELSTIPLDDPATYALLSAGDTDGVFQLESDGMRRVLRQLRPNCIEDIIATNALYRPGPMEHIPDFIAAKGGRVELTYLHPKLEPILCGTYGVVVYQEQVMRIAHEIAGFSLGEADTLRRGMSKRDPSLVQALKDQFVSGACSNGIPEETAREIFELIKPFGSYGFNKSHSAAYGILAYQTAWFKTHYPLYYFAALLTSFQGYQDQIKKYVQYLKGRGFTFLQPDINLSQQQFSVDRGSIRFGLLAIKNMGITTVESILRERERQGAFSGLRDFVSRLGTEVNKRHMTALINAGAFDPLGSRAEHLLLIPELQDQLSSTANRLRQGQMSLMGREQELHIDSFYSGINHGTGAFSARELQNMEVEATGFAFTRTPDEEREQTSHLRDSPKVATRMTEAALSDPAELFILIGSKPKFTLETLKEILQRFPGDTPVYIDMHDLKRIQKVPREYWVTIQDELLNQLRRLAGTSNVYIKKRDIG